MTETNKQTGPDVRQLGQNGLADASLPGGRKQPFRIFFDPGVHSRIWKHAAESIGVEICGVLVGKWAKDGDGPFGLVTEAIRGEAATNKMAEVTFTHETWAKINLEMDTKHASLSIVGWYHSHPNFGVFLSDRDRFIQEHFFSGPGQVAHVVDPVRKTEGVFAWQDGKPALLPHYWIGDRVQVPTAAGQETAAAEQAGQAETGPPRQGPGGQNRDPGDWLTFLAPVGLYLVLFLLGFLLAGKLNQDERIRIEENARNNAMARALVFFKVRPFLTDDVIRTRKSLDAAVRDIVDLAKAHLKLVEKPRETQEKWQEALTALRDCRDRLGAIQETYGLTPEQMEILKREEKAREPKDDKAKDKKPAPEKDKKSKDKDTKTPTKPKDKDGKTPVKPKDKDSGPADKKSSAKNK